MLRVIDTLDLLIALGLSAFVVFWAMQWGYPYPYPDLWPCLAILKDVVRLPILGALGRVGLGAFSALVYLNIRCVWILNRAEDDDRPDRFLWTRLSALAASLTAALMPAVWRMGQYLSPEFLLVLMLLLGLFVWLLCRGYRGLVGYAISYVLFGFGLACNPLISVLLIYVSVMDVIGRWQEARELGAEEEDMLVAEKMGQETLISGFMALFGFGLGALAMVRYRATAGFTWDVPVVLRTWTGAWLGNFDQTIVSPLMITLGSVTAVAVVGLALGKRIRSVGLRGRTLAVVLTVMLNVLMAVLIVRAVDSGTRLRLLLIRDYVRSVVADAGDVKWLFTDGRFDDIIKYELAQARSNTHVMNALRPPSASEQAQMREWAPEVGERELFAAGGAEIFKAWARERPERLAESAWMFGGGLIHQFGKAHQTSCGSILRTDPKPEMETRYKIADEHQALLFKTLLRAVEKPTRWERNFGSVSKRIRDLFDALLWRAGRLAVVRAEQLSAKGKIDESQAIRETVQRMDSMNSSLHAQGLALERLLPTASLVLTPREALEVSLKRADFVLAARYAREVLSTSPNDTQGNFALGMVGLETKDFFAASRHFEAVIKVTPDEPAALNNLALAYLKLGKYQKALACAEHAARVHPSSPEIQSNLDEIRNKIAAGAKSNEDEPVEAPEETK